MAISNNNTGIRTGVCTSTTRPTAPYEGQHIYETDTDIMLVWSGSAWVEIASMLTKAPRGIINRVTAITTQNFTTTSSVDFTSLSITFTAVANRYYKISFSLPSVTGSASNRFVTQIRDGSNNELLAIYNEVTSLGFSIAAYTVKTFSAGSTTIKLSGYRDAGSNTIGSFGASTSPMELIVEDIGAA